MKRYSAIYIMFLLLIFTTVICFIIPSGSYVNDTFNYINNDSNIIYEFIKAPINGLVSFDNGSTINFYNSGSLSGVIILCLLIISIFIYTNIVIDSNYLTNYLHTKYKYINKHINIFIILLILFFLFSSYTHGMYETTISISVILFIIFEKLGFKKIYVTKIILYSTSIGYMTSTINPFATKLASDLASVSLKDSFLIRIILFIILSIFTIIILLKEKDKYKTNNSDLKIDSNIKVNNYDFIIFLLPFIYMSYSFLPFNLYYKLTMNQIIIMFIIFSLYFAFKYLKNIKVIVSKIVKSITLTLPLILVLSLSRSIYIILYNTSTDDTLIYYLTILFKDTNFIIITIILFIVYFILAIFIPSSSAIAFITIPILSSFLANINYDNSLLVTIYQSSIGITHIFSITSVVVLTLLSSSNYSYKDYIKESYKYIISITLITIVILLINTYLI